MVRLLCLTLFLVSTTYVSRSDAILQPFDTATRYSKSLDGIWNFRLLPGFGTPKSLRLPSTDNNEPLVRSS
jgi:hypothetical protein